MFLAFGNGKRFAEVGKEWEGSAKRMASKLDERLGASPSLHHKCKVELLHIDGTDLPVVRMELGLLPVEILAGPKTVKPAALVALEEIKQHPTSGFYAVDIHIGIRDTGEKTYDKFGQPVKGTEGFSPAMEAVYLSGTIERIDLAHFEEENSLDVADALQDPLKLKDEEPKF